MLTNIYKALLYLLVFFSLICVTSSNICFSLCSLACIFLDVIRSSNCKYLTRVHPHNDDAMEIYVLSVYFISFCHSNVDYNLIFWQLLLAVGTKLEHIIIALAHEVAHKNSVITGNLVVTPSDQLFWFKKPRIVIYLIHFILFQNAFEIAFFFWILVSSISYIT